MNHLRRVFQSSTRIARLIMFLQRLIVIGLVLVCASVSRASIVLTHFTTGSTVAVFDNHAKWSAASGSTSQSASWQGFQAERDQGPDVPSLCDLVANTSRTPSSSSSSSSPSPNGASAGALASGESVQLHYKNACSAIVSFLARTFVPKNNHQLPFRPPKSFLASFGT